MSDELTVEATGETVGEAKWKALRELERLAPGARQGGGPLPGRSRRASAACSASATRRRGWSRPRPPRRRRRGRAAARRRERGRAARCASSLEHVDGRDRDRAAGSTCARPTTALDRDVHRRRPRAPDRPARPDDRRAPVARERDRCAGGERRARRSSSTPPATATGAAGRSRRSRCASAEEALRTRRARRARADERAERKVVHERAQGLRRGGRRRARATSRIATSSSASPCLTSWLARASSRRPGLTALATSTTRAACCSRTRCARAALVARLDGPVVDVGSGGGAPGHPARARAARTARSCCSRPSGASASSSSAWAPPNARVVWGRAEEQETDWAGVALAKALAPPPVAAEWCLPLVRPGGVVVLWVGETADLDRVAARRRAARRRARATRRRGSLVLRKTGPTPPGFPRRTGRRDASGRSPSESARASSAAVG